MAGTGGKSSLSVEAAAALLCVLVAAALDTPTSAAIAEGQLEDARDPARREILKAKIDRYESDPVTGEGKRELMARALKIEAERDEAKQHTPWLTFSGMAFQLGIVLLSAAILAVSMNLFWGSIAVSAFGTLLMTQGLWMWLPLTI